MTIISAMLLLAYGTHVTFVLWHRQSLGMTELTYIIPICLCLAVVWIWQSRHIPKFRNAPPFKMPRHPVSGEELDELIEERRLDDEAEAQRALAEQQLHDQNGQRFLFGIQEWQARQRWLQDGT